jgi:hypothetical protein
MFCYIYIGIGKVQLVMYTASIRAVTVANSDVQLQHCVPNSTLHSCPNCNCRYMAALVPLLQAIRLTAAGFAAAKQAANAPLTSSSSSSSRSAEAELHSGSAEPHRQRQGGSRRPSAVRAGHCSSHTA